MNIQTIYTIIATVGAIAAIIFGFSALKRNTRDDNRNNGERNGALMTEIGYIKSGIDDIKHKQEKSDERGMAMLERIATVESSVKQAHKRIDVIEKGVIE